MSQNLIKPTSRNSWLVANLRVWGAAPTLLIVALTCLIRGASMNTVFGGMSVGTALIFALILSGVRKGDSVMVGYSISYFFAFIAQFLVIGDIANKTAGEIWVLVSFILSLPIGWIVYQYIHENYDDFVSRYYKYRTAKTDRHGNRLWIAYLGFVEGSIFSYTAFTALGGFFL